MANDMTMEQKKQNKQSTLLVTDIQRFSVHDGPGVRTTVFLKGCPCAAAGAIILRHMRHFRKCN